MIVIFAFIVAFLYSQVILPALALGYFVSVVSSRPEHPSLVNWLHGHSFDYKIFTLVLVIPLVTVLID
jgi:hypothetical protein